MLKNDLETMRNKVLSEILKSNKLKETNRELTLKHDQELNEYRTRINELEEDNCNLRD